MEAVIKQEDLTIAVNYGEMMSFIFANCGIENENKAWKYAEKLTNGIMCEETVIYKCYDSVKKDTYSERNGFGDEKEWLLKFFEAHPFLTKIMIYFND